MVGGGFSRDRRDGQPEVTPTPCKACAEESDRANARGRLEEAALALHAERGFDQTTVAEIAERAALTERTFFRRFAHTREPLRRNRIRRRPSGGVD